MFAWAWGVPLAIPRGKLPQLQSKCTGLHRLKAHLLRASDPTCRDELLVRCRESSAKKGQNVLSNNVRSLVSTLSTGRQEPWQLSDRATVQMFDSLSVTVGVCRELVAHGALRTHSVVQSRVWRCKSLGLPLSMSTDCLAAMFPAQRARHGAPAKTGDWSKLVGTQFLLDPGGSHFHFGSPFLSSPPTPCMRTSPSFHPLQACCKTLHLHRVGMDGIPCHQSSLHSVLETGHHPPACPESRVTVGGRPRTCPLVRGSSRDSKYEWTSDRSKRWIGTTPTEHRDCQWT